MMTERCGRCANLSGLCAMVGCGGFVEKAPLEAVEEIANIAQQANTAICGCGGSGVVDSGGQEPWGQFINVPCPECRKQQ